MGDGDVEGNGEMGLVHLGVHLLTPMLRNILAPLLSGRPHSTLMVGVYQFVYYSEVQNTFLVCMVLVCRNGLHEFVFAY